MSFSSFWTGLFSAEPKNRFTVDELQRLYMVLLRNQVISDTNRDTVVETLRSITELTIWGDQHDPAMVEYFLTENLLGHFHQILLQRSGRRGTVAVQVLQVKCHLQILFPLPLLSFLFFFFQLIHFLVSC